MTGTFRRRHLVIPLLFLAACLFFGPASGICAPLESQCLSCHGEAAGAKKYTHPPYTLGCSTCHLRDEQKKHPTQKSSIILRENVPGLCFRCHDKARFTREYTHPVALNGCVRRCHNPHSSEKPHLLSQPVNEVCSFCHTVQRSGAHIASLPGGRIHPISGVPDPRDPDESLTCMSCHVPHSSRFEKLYRSGHKCKRCHKIY